MSIVNTRPWTVLVISRNPTFSTATSHQTIWAAGREPGTHDTVAAQKANQWVGRPTYFWGEQESQGDNPDDIDNTLGYPHSDSEYIYTVASAAAGDDIKMWAADDNDSLFTYLGNMGASPNFTSPVTDFPLDRLFLGVGWDSVAGEGARRFLDGRIVSVQVWKNKALTESELNAILQHPDKFFKHLTQIINDPVDVGVPTRSLEVRAHVPRVSAGVQNPVNLPTGQLTTTGHAITVAAGGDGNTDIPTSSLEARSHVPTITAGIRNDINLPTGQLAVTTYAISVAAGTDDGINVPRTPLQVNSYAPNISSGGDASIMLPTGNLVINGHAPGIDAGADDDIGLPTGSLSVNSHPPETSTGAGDNISLPTANVVVNTYPPDVIAGYNDYTTLPRAALTVTSYAPGIQSGSGHNISLGGATITVNAYSPTIVAGGSHDIGLPAGSLVVSSYAITVAAGADQSVDLPRTRIQVRTYNPSTDAAITGKVGLPSGTLHVRSYVPVSYTGDDRFGPTLQDAVVLIKETLEPLLEAAGLTQTYWPNMPRRQENDTPFVRVAINVEDRELADIGGTPRTIGAVQMQVCTPYGWDPKQHDTYVNDCLNLISDNQYENVQFFTSVPITTGRLESFWMTRVETDFYIENV